jgi:hypothetical protein
MPLDFLFTAFIKVQDNNLYLFYIEGLGTFQYIFQSVIAIIIVPCTLYHKPKRAPYDKMIVRYMSGVT